MLLFVGSEEQLPGPKPKLVAGVCCRGRERALAFFGGLVVSLLQLLVAYWGGALALTCPVIGLLLTITAACHGVITGLQSSVAYTRPFHYSSHAPNK